MLLCYSTKFERVDRLIELAADDSAYDDDGNNVLSYILTARSPFHIATLKLLPDYDIHATHDEAIKQDDQEEVFMNGE